MSMSRSLEHWNIPLSGKGDLADGIKSRVWDAEVMLGEHGELDVIRGSLQKGGRQVRENRSYAVQTEEGTGSGEAQVALGRWDRHRKRCSPQASRRSQL